MAMTPTLWGIKMTGIVIKPTTAQLVDDETIKYFDDYYAGKIPIECGEDCAEQCDRDHGYYKPVKYEPLFEISGDKNDG